MIGCEGPCCYQPVFCSKIFQVPGYDILSCRVTSQESYFGCHQGTSALATAIRRRQLIALCHDCELLTRQNGRWVFLANHNQYYKLCFLFQQLVGELRVKYEITFCYSICFRCQTKENRLKCEITFLYQLKMLDFCCVIYFGWTMHQ